jgi:hypothetical protein
VLKEDGYSYGINNSIKLQILQLESHGSQLSGAKHRTFLSCPGQVLLEREYEKVVKNKNKSPCTVKLIATKISTFLRISQELVVIS